MSDSLAIPQTSTVSSVQTAASDTSRSMSRETTFVNLSDALKGKDVEAPDATPIANVLASAEAEKDATQPAPAAPRLSQQRKWGLLVIFSLAMFIDILCYSAFFVLTGTISTELEINAAEQSWVITSYSVTFAAFLLFWGRVSDLYSAKPTFVFGFIALGTLNLVISFLPDRYSFFVIRALAGIAGAALIPSSYRLIVFVFEPAELGKAFTVYGMSGAISNVFGTIIAGFIDYIPQGGQMQNWRWFFRITAILILPVAVASIYLIPKDEGDNADVESKWKRLDLVGSVLMLAAIVLLILGLTLGASYGWKTAGFLVPFLLSWVLFPAFFLWEARLPEEYALIPAKTWRIPNFTMFIVFALQIYAWWGVNFLALVENYTEGHGEKAIIAAVRMLPEGGSALAVTVLLTAYPSLVSRPRWPIAIGMLLGAVGYVLFAQAHTTVGADYWRYIFPGGLLGSGGMNAAFTGTTVGVMLAVPSDMAGVAGAVLQVAFQAGAAVGFAVQAGLLTVNDGGVANYENIQASFYFQLGWIILWLVGFLVLYRPAENVSTGAADSAEQGRPVLVH
ncbi:hypothetical protein Q5752_006261 [Cryptotrichosporon argae]